MARKRPRTSLSRLPEDIRTKPMPASTRAEDLSYLNLPLCAPPVDLDLESPRLAQGKSSAKERRKALLDRLRDIDAKKAALAATFGGVKQEDGTIEEVPYNPIIKHPKKEDEQNLSSGAVASLLKDEEKLLQSLEVSHLSLPVPAAGKVEEKKKPHNEGSASKPCPKPAARKKSGVAKAGTCNIPLRRTSRVRTSIAASQFACAEVRAQMVYQGLSKCRTLAFSKKLINTMLRDPLSRPFSAPVDELWPPEAIPRYNEVVKKPMDLGTIKRKLEDCCYILTYPDDNVMDSASFVSGSSSPRAHPAQAVPKSSNGNVETGFIFDLAEFCRDVRLCFRNCMQYCGDRDLLYPHAKSLLEKFDTEIRSAPAVVPIVRSKTKKPRRGSKSKNDPTAECDTPEKHRSSVCDDDDDDDEGSDRESESDDESSDSESDADQSTRDAGSRRSHSPSQREKRKRKDRATDTRIADDAVDSPVGAIEALKNRLRYLEKCEVQVKARLSGVDRFDIPMSYNEKAKLTDHLSELPVERVSELVKIVFRALGKDANNTNDEIEIDLDKLDNRTLRELEELVNGSDTSVVSVGDEFASVQDLQAEIVSVSVQLKHAKASVCAAKATGLWDSSSSDSDSDNSQSSQGSSDEDDDEDGDGDEDGVTEQNSNLDGNQH